MESHRVMSIRLTASALIVAAVVLLPSFRSVAQAQAPTYLERLHKRANDWQAALPEIRTSAADAAAKVMAGGNLYVAGPQQTFPKEALGRAGGLMLTRGYAETLSLTSNDVILAATTTTNESPELQRLFENAQRGGATIILFGNGYVPPSFTPANFHRLPRKPFVAVDAKGSPSIESLSNLIGLWGWTGEFVGACVARGRMPCVYESYGMPGGGERAETLKGRRFHETNSVMPSDARNLGADFFRKAAEALKQTDAMNRYAFGEAAAMIRDCHSAGKTIRVDGIGHIFPCELQQPPTPSWFNVGSSSAPRNPGDVVIFLGYQSFPWALARAVTAEGGRWIVTCSHRPPTEPAAASGNVYLNPMWDVQDACLPLKGYDVRLFPLSGIMDGAIYWQLVDISVCHPSGKR